MAWTAEVHAFAHELTGNFWRYRHFDFLPFLISVLCRQRRIEVGARRHWRRRGDDPYGPGGAGGTEISRGEVVGWRDL